MLPRDARARRGPRGAVAADGDDRGDVLAVAEMAGQQLALSPRVVRIGIMNGHGDREPGGLDQDGRSVRTAWSPRSPASVNSRRLVSNARSERLTGGRGRSYDSLGGDAEVERMGRPDRAGSRRCRSGPR